MKEYNLIKQFTPDAWKAALENANRAAKAVIRDGDKADSKDTVKKKRGRPKKNATKA